MATKEAEDMESLCLRQNRRFHILRFSPNDGISVLLICLIFSGISKYVISSFSKRSAEKYRRRQPGNSALKTQNIKFRNKKPPR